MADKRTAAQKKRDREAAAKTIKAHLADEREQAAGGFGEESILEPSPSAQAEAKEMAAAARKRAKDAATGKTPHKPTAKKKAAAPPKTKRAPTEEVVPDEEGPVDKTYIKRRRDPEEEPEPKKHRTKEELRETLNRASTGDDSDPRINGKRLLLTGIASGKEAWLRKVGLSRCKLTHDPDLALQWAQEAVAEEEDGGEPMLLALNCTGLLLIGDDEALQAAADADDERGQAVLDAIAHHPAKRLTDVNWRESLWLVGSCRAAGGIYTERMDVLADASDYDGAIFPAEPKRLAKARRRHAANAS